MEYVNKVFLVGLVSFFLWIVLIPMRSQGKDNGSYNTLTKKDKAIIDSCNSMASRLIDQDTDSSWFYVREGIRHIGSATNSIEYADLLLTAGRLHTIEEVRDSALLAFNKAEIIFKKHNATTKLAKLYDKYAYFYQKLRDYDMLLNYITRGHNVRLKSKNDKDLHITFFLYGNYHFYKKQHQIAIDYFQRCLELQKEHSPDHIPQTLIAIGYPYIYLNKSDSTLLYWEEAISGKYKIAPREELYVNLALGRFYAKRHEYEKAVEYLEHTGELLKVVKDQELERTHLDYSADVHQSLGNYKQALDYRLKIQDLADPFFQDNLDQINNLNSILEVEAQRLKETEELRQQNLRDIQKSQITLRAILIIALMLLGSIAMGYHFRYKRQLLELKLKEERIQALQREQKLENATALLQGQDLERKRISRDLHDGLGVMMSSARMQLSALKETMQEYGKREMMENCLRLMDDSCHDLRRISHNMMPSMLTKFGLAKALKSMFESVSNNGLVSIEHNIDFKMERLLEEVEIMLYRIVQEMVNNTIKHADASKVTFVLVSDVANNELRFQFNDNGKGFSIKQAEEGLGLKNIHTRVEFLKGTIHMHSQPGHGTTYTVHIPIIDEGSTFEDQDQFIA